MSPHASQVLHAFGEVLANFAPGVAVILVLFGILKLAVDRYERRPAGDSRRAGPPALLLRTLLLFRHLPDPVEMLRNRRRARIRATPFPHAWRAMLVRNVPLYRTLSAEDQRELEKRVQVLLAEKHFEGCGGLRLTDEIRLTIAAHAALLLHGDDRPRYYPGLATILVYPSAYAAPVEDREGGVVTERSEGRLGESWKSGVVVVSWDAARGGARDPRDGENVIIHEFSHQLDTEDGAADGVPYLDTPADYQAWGRALAPEYERLREHPEESVLREYGATNPAEFFAVATETFFEKPQQMRERHPALYEELSRFYRLDPARALSRTEPERIRSADQADAKIDAE